MENPLRRIFPTEERDDGVYIKVDRSLREKVNPDTVITVLDKLMITNADATAIRDVMTRARGGFEKIGPKFEYYDPQLDAAISVTVEPQKATMALDGEAFKKGISLSINKLRYRLKRAGVLFGVKEDVLKQFLGSPQPDTEIIVAEGTPSRPGSDGRLEWDVDLSTDAAPVIGADGRVDYRSTKSFISVTQGQVIARRIPPTAGTPGKSVTGEEIAPQPCPDVTLPKGTNTEITEDGLQLLASKNGVVIPDDGLITIKELLNISGDVNFSVGNIKYSGDVIVRGNVRPGFVVETEGDIHVFGEVESARIISRNGIVKIQKGVMGKSDTYVFARKAIHVGFAQNASLVTEGDLTVEKSLMNCSCRCSRLEESAPGASIIGGDVHVYEQIEVSTVGNEKNTETLLVLVDRAQQMAGEKIGELKELLGKIDEQLEPIKRDLKSKSAIMRKAGSNLGEKNRDAVKKLIDTYTSMTKKREYVESKVEEQRRRQEGLVGRDGFIRVKTCAFPGTKINLYDAAEKALETKLNATVFRLEGNAVTTEG